MAERQEFTLSAGELGILSTEEIVAGENFLNSDPDDITLASKKKPTKKKIEEEEEDDVDEVEDSDEKIAPKKEKKVKEVISESKELSEEEMFGSLTDEEQEEEEEEEILEKKPKKVNAQKEPPKKQETEESEKTTEEEEEDDTSVYATIAKELVTHGVLTLDEDEEEIDVQTPEQLLERFQYEGQKQATAVINKFLGRFGEQYREMFDSVFVKGVDPLDYLNRYAKIEAVKNLDLTDEGNQERVVRELYRSEGRSAEYIEKKLIQLKNYNDLAEEATEAQRILVQREEQANKEAELQKEQEIKRKAMIRNEYVNNVSRILNDKIRSREFDGIPVDKNFAERTYAYLTEERYETRDHQLLTEFDKDILELNRPENHELKIKVAMLMQLLREDPTLSKLARKAVSKESNELFKGLKRTAMKSAEQPKKNSEPKSWFQS
jgi:hypothetical protein